MAITLLPDDTQHLEGDCECKLPFIHFQCRSCGAHNQNLEQPCRRCNYFKFRAVYPHSPEIPQPAAPKNKGGRPKKVYR